MQTKSINSIPATAYLLGTWASILTAIFAVAFVIGSIIFSPTIWLDMESYLKNYRQREILVWIPCFLFALTYLLINTTIGSTVTDEKRLYQHIALAFAVIYSITICLNSYIQITVLRLNIISGTAEELSILALPNPHSLTYALEGLGYFFLGLSTLFLSFTFGSSKIELAIRILYIINAITGIVGLLICILDIPILMLPGIGIWSLEYPIVNILLFVFFRRLMKNQLNPHNKSL